MIGQRELIWQYR